MNETGNGSKETERERRIMWSLFIHPHYNKGEGERRWEWDL